MLADYDKALFQPGLTPAKIPSMTMTRLARLTAWAQAQQQDPALSLQLISGDASFRRYYRAQGWIWVDAPPETEKNREFVRNAEALANGGLIAPRVRAWDAEQGLLCVSDLGDTLLLGCLTDENVEAWYAKALALLPHLAVLPLAPQLEPFDAAFMARENAIFPEWLLERHLGLDLSESERSLLTDTFAILAANNLAQPQCVMHRDFHSRNLMVLPDGQLGILDFQDMVRGPLTYDVVSLLKDCYVRWPDAVIEAGVARAFAEFEAAGLTGGASLAQFRHWLDLTGMQRHLKAAGIFARLCHRDGKTGYLKDIPRTLDYVLDVARAEPALAAFADWLSSRVISRLEALPCEP